MDVEKEGSCQILGSLGFLVQMILGVLSFTVLISKIKHKLIFKFILKVKRFYEKPKRKWRIWILVIIYNFTSKKQMLFLKGCLETRCKCSSSSHAQCNFGDNLKYGRQQRCMHLVFYYCYV